MTKSNNQNAIFHALLTEFWKSGCSSHESVIHQRLYYKDVAGLVMYEQVELSKQLKTLLRALYKTLPSSGLKEELKDIINKKRVTELSWASVEKEQATISIKTLIDDMVEAGVNSKKFQEIINAISKGS